MSSEGQFHAKQKKKHNSAIMNQNASTFDETSYFVENDFNDTNHINFHFELIFCKKN